MKRVESAGDMAARLNEAIKSKRIDNFFAEKADMFATIMSGTHGRDKICALLQYSNEFYYQCAISSEDRFRRIHWTVPAARGLAKNVSNSRKMLKFLNFVEYI